MTPGYTAPKHLAEYAQRLENCIGATMRTVVSIPPRHGKTELILHAIAYLLRKDPRITIGYASYSAALARSKSRRARTIAQGAGVQLSEDMANLDEWRTTAGGGVLAGGVGGAWTGHGLDVLIVDDPVKNRQEAESATVRESVHDWYTSTAYTRLEPNASVFVNMTRWHEGDLAGRLLAGDEHFDEINFPAIDETETQPLWPERWTADALLRVKRVNEYDWHSLWMGRPRPKGGAVFGAPHYYDEIPDGGFRVGIGFDLAYTAKKRADASALCILRMVGSDPTEAVFYVEDVVAKRVEAPDFFGEVRMALADFPGAQAVFRYAGPEKGMIDTMRREGIRVKGIPTRGDKFTNAQEFAAAWNDGRVLVPRRYADADEVPHWVQPFVDEVQSFTGVDGRHDDMVDAAISAHLACVGSPAVVWL